MKSLMRKIQNLLPVYRCSNTILKTITTFQYETSQLKRVISDLDKKNEYLFWLLSRKDNETLSETKKRVFLELPKEEGLLEKIQSINNYILRRIKKICDENNIEFFLLWGTLLGAVRHNGFIPWDDDIDIGMMRDEYIRFAELIRDDPKLQVGMTYAKWGRVVTKVKLKGYDTFWVDIFIHDYLDIDDACYDEAWNKYYATAIEFNKEVDVIADSYFDALGSPKYCDYIDEAVDSIRNKYYSELPLYGHGNYVCESIENRISSIHRAYEKKMVFPLRKNELIFENTRYSAWNNYDEHLRMYYGNIWSFPNNICENHETEYAPNVYDECERFMKSVNVNENLT